MLLKGINIIFILCSVVILVSSIIYLAPVDPARLTFGQRLDEASLERKKSELYLDRSFPVQVAHYLNDISPISMHDPALLKKNDVSAIPLYCPSNTCLVLKTPYLRTSYQSGRKVASLISAALPNTLILTLVALSFATFFGVFLGVFSAIKRGTFWDQAIISLATMGISVPSYVSAIILALLFGYLWGDYTGLDIQGSLFELDDWGDKTIRIKNLILPAIALGIRPLSIITQLMRASVLDVLSMPHIMTARAKGLSFFKILRRHVLRNASNPVITAVSGWFASLLAGTFFIETVFNFKGIGELTVNALVNYDIPVILGCTLFVASVFIFVNMFIDLIYNWLDPRMK